MNLSRLFAVGLCALLASSAVAAKKVPVTSSEVTFDSVITKKIAGKSTKLVCTGTALRTKYFFSVYAMASYIKKGVKVSSAKELAKADVPKQLYLVLERTVSGESMAAAIKESITANYPEETFPEDLKKFFDFIKAKDVEYRSRVCITHLPGVGFHCDIQGKRKLTIKNLKLAHAIWEIYLGEKNIGVAIKEGLVSRL